MLGFRLKRSKVYLGSPDYFITDTSGRSLCFNIHEKLKELLVLGVIFHAVFVEINERAENHLQRI